MAWKVFAFHIWFWIFVPPMYVGAAVGAVEMYFEEDGWNAERERERESSCKTVLSQQQTIEFCTTNYNPLLTMVLSSWKNFKLAAYISYNAQKDPNNVYLKWFAWFYSKITYKMYYFTLEKLVSAGTTTKITKPKNGKPKRHQVTEVQVLPSSAPRNCR